MTSGVLESANKYAEVVCAAAQTALSASDYK